MWGGQRSRTWKVPLCKCELREGGGFQGCAKRLELETPPPRFFDSHVVQLPFIFRSPPHRTHLQGPRCAQNSSDPSNTAVRKQRSLLAGQWPFPRPCLTLLHVLVKWNAIEEQAECEPGDNRPAASMDRTLPYTASQKWEGVRSMRWRLLSRNTAARSIQCRSQWPCWREVEKSLEAHIRFRTLAQRQPPPNWASPGLCRLFEQKSDIWTTPQAPTRSVCSWFAATLHATLNRGCGRAGLWRIGLLVVVGLGGQSTPFWD